MTVGAVFELRKARQGQALALAGHLSEMGERRGGPVALSVLRSSELIVGALGIGNGART